jgi:flagellar L-ring protein precursor FlgH
MKTKFESISRSRHLLLWLALIAATVATAATVHAGSLWREGVTDERGMFADKRAKRIGDIVTVVVNENVGMTNSLNLTTAKQNSSGMATGIEGVASNIVNQFVTTLPSTLLGKRIQHNAGNQGVAVPTVPALTVNGTNSFTGGGTITNNQTITGSAAVQVVDVLPNGNLVIEGLREISFSKERQFMSLHGIVRPYDIQPDNTISSSNIAGAQVQIVSEGTLTDAQKKGWLLKLNDKISPF